MILAACQSPPPQSAAGQSGSSTGTPIEQSSEQTPAEERSSATANADGSPIVFDPVDAGKHLPDPCLELSEEVLQKIGFTTDYERFTYGLDDELLGKGISCDLNLIEETEAVVALGFYTDNVTKDYIQEQGLFIRDALDSKVPNAYFYTFSPRDRSSCFIGAHTTRGRLGMVATGPTTWTWEESCSMALDYFDRTYEATDGFAWLKSWPTKDDKETDNDSSL
ncbi:hypothetical protein OS128_09035 [Corynebacterium sp. P5848]|uniref:hypothetical protein n=1 Tax=Corynebacterium marambiense TaxID=2765364 RepID=UPI002260C38C|nr:hypothetical protein [Corynebacterium marambiense]MCX7543060.1 hypothetical protein [Corynebacterium marambiense]